MIDDRTGRDIHEIPVLSQEQLYVYIILNEVGKVKVGVTHDLVQRMNNLGGSNSQGNHIVRCYCSPATYLNTIEGIMHNRMKDYRIKGTEWFYYDEDSSGGILYDSVIELMGKLFNSKDYVKCNILRQQNYMLLNNGK